MTKPATRTQSRENWLHAAIDMLRPMFVQIGAELPETIHVSVGFSSKGKGGENRVIRGECWSRAASEDGANHVFISPEIGDTATVLAVLMHELVHVSDDNASGHKAHFAEAATRLGMTSPFTTATPDMALSAELIVMAAELGDYGHAKLDAHAAKRVPVGPGGEPVKVTSGPATQTNRHIKLVCGEHGQYSLRLSRGVLDMGAPGCGICGQEMQLA
jgi:hypothetical protein